MANEQLKARTMAEDGNVLAVLPVRRVLFPGQLSSFAIGKKASVALIDYLLTERLGLRALGGRRHRHRTSHWAIVLALTLKIVVGHVLENYDTCVRVHPKP